MSSLLIPQFLTFHGDINNDCNETKGSQYKAETIKILMMSIHKTKICLKISKICKKCDENEVWRVPIERLIYSKSARS